MEAITLPVYNSEGKQIETFKLDKEVFDGTINPAVLHQVVKAYQANQRKGLATTKTRGEVSGGGVKPWRQKGTGRARVGSIRSPLWRGGGITFGPKTRDFSTKTPKQIKKLALKTSLNVKLKENNLIILDVFKIDSPKTKPAAKIFAQSIFQPASNLLLLLDKLEDNQKLALRNIDFLNFNLAQNIHAYDVLTCRKLLITKTALTALTKRLK